LIDRFRSSQHNHILIEHPIPSVGMYFTRIHPMSDKDNTLKIIDHRVNVSIVIASIIDFLFIPNGIFIVGSIFVIAALFFYRFNKVRIPPDYFPVISEDWVLWEYTICIDTKGVKLKIEELHDALAKEVNHQNIPLNVFYARDACWIVKQLDSIKIHNDFRSRVIVQLEDSPYRNIHFIAGLDYLGTCWVNLHLMIINYPQHLKKIPKPLRRDRYLTKVNSISIKAAGIGLVIIINLYQAGNTILGSILLILLLIACCIVININHEFNILPPYKMYSKAEIIKYERMIEQSDKITSIQSEELPRNFKWDDLRLFHEVTRRLVTDIIFERLEPQEPIFTEAKEFNLFKNIIPSTKKDLFDNVR
jgi:hypothetical protein